MASGHHRQIEERGSALKLNRFHHEPMEVKFRPGCADRERRETVFIEPQRFLMREHDLKHRSTAGIRGALEATCDEAKWIILMFQAFGDRSPDLPGEFAESGIA